VLRPARLRHAPAGPARTLRGSPPELVRITEGDLVLAVDLAAGQKTGTYLDLRGLRREVAAAPLAGARVLNLFAYAGMLGLAAEHAGATAIVQVDASERALAFAAAHHVRAPARHTFVVADVFAWLPAFAAEPFDLVIVDDEQGDAGTVGAGGVSQAVSRRGPARAARRGRHRRVLHQPDRAPGVPPDGPGSARWAVLTRPRDPAGARSSGRFFAGGLPEDRVVEARFLRGAAWMSRRSRS